MLDIFQSSLLLPLLYLSSSSLVGFLGIVVPVLASVTLRCFWAHGALHLHLASRFWGMLGFPKPLMDIVFLYFFFLYFPSSWYAGFPFMLLSIKPQSSISCHRFLFISNIFMISGSVNVYYSDFFDKHSVEKVFFTRELWECRLSRPSQSQFEWTVFWDSKLIFPPEAFCMLPFPRADWEALVWLALQVWGEQQGSRVG